MMRDEWDGAASVSSLDDCKSQERGLVLLTRRVALAPVESWVRS